MAVRAYGGISVGIIVEVELGAKQKKPISFSVAKTRLVLQLDPSPSTRGRSPPLRPPLPPTLVYKRTALHGMLGVEEIRVPYERTRPCSNQNLVTKSSDHDYYFF